MQSKLSVIIPIYNGEPYLPSCIASVQRQTEAVPEIILIDDGSGDRSGRVCDEAALQDARILTVHQPNSGVSAARNAGIALATGEYLGFADADDTIRPEMYETLLQTARETDADVVMCDAVTVYPDGRTEPDTITQLPGDRIIEKNDWTPSLLSETAGSACRCVYRRVGSGIEGTEQRFPVGVKLSEDRIFNLYAMGRANRVAYLKRPFYERRVHGASCVMSFHADHFERVKLAHHETVLALREAWRDDPAYQKAYLAQFIGGAVSAINNYWYRTSTLPRGERIRRVKTLCADPELQEAIRQYGSGDLRARLIRNRRARLLSAIAVILNVKHGR